MARPRKHTSPDRFTSTEMAVAAGISTRSFNVLVESGCSPKPTVQAEGKRGTSYWNSHGIGEVALIGAVHKSGAELIMSAKIARFIIDEFVSARGHLPSRLDDFLHQPLNPTPGQYPWKNADKISLRISDDFWLHHLLKTRTKIYQPETAMEGDMVLEIVDRIYIFTDFAFSKRNVPKLNPWSLSASNTPEMSLKIEGWERGRNAVIRPLYELIDFSAAGNNPDANAIASAVEDEWLSARKNAVGILRVNVSLAIRNAFDAVHDSRRLNRTLFDWTCTDEPQGDRYEGSFPDGTPLNPNHPWNSALSPAQRAERLIAIEEYLSAIETKPHG